MQISRYAITRPITTVMLALSVMVMGAISLFRLPLEYAPGLSWPSMYVSVSYPSSSPEEVEQRITRPLEEALGTLPNVKSISASSYSSRSSVRLEFGYDADMELMAVHVRDRIDIARRDFPPDVDRVEVQRWNTEDFPILTYTLTWMGDDPAELGVFYRNSILPRLQRLEGVGSVEVSGLDEKALLVNVSQNRLKTHGLDIQTLDRAVRLNNANLSAGYVEDAGKRLAVRSIGEFEAVDQIRHLPLRNGIELGDVADVTYDYPEKKTFERLDGRDAVSLDIRKSSTANLVSTARVVNAEVRKIAQEPGGELLRVQTVRDRSVDVTDGVKNLAFSAGVGGLLAVLVIFVFLRNFRSTLIIGSSIPISALCVFMIMYLMRQFLGASITLNLISMMGLMVAVGMLVDPAVVALENIYRKRYEAGQDAWTAALEGSREIAVAVLAASLTTVCVFVPLIFITDSSSSLWMRDFAITVCISVMASLGAALTLIPLAASRAFGSGGARLDSWLKIILGALVLAGLGWGAVSGDLMPALQGGLGAVWGAARSVSAGAWGALVLAAAGGWGVYRWLSRVGVRALYVRMVNTTLRYRWTTVAVAVAVLGAGFYLFGQIEKQPYRYQPTRRVDFSVDLPRSYAMVDALGLFDQVERILMPRKAELDIEAISTRFSSRQSSRITLYLVSAEQGKLTTDEVTRRVQALLPEDIPGVRFKAGGGGRRSSSSTIGVGVEIKGRDPSVLAILAEDVKLGMVNIPGVLEVETSLESGLEEVRVTVNRNRAQRYGLSPVQVAATVATALGTRGSSKFKTDEGEIDITVQLKEDDRATLEQLKNTVFQSTSGNLVSFGTLADFRLQKGPNTIVRQDRMSTVTVFANTEQPAVYSVGREMQNRMAQLVMPSGYSWQMDRSFRWISQEQRESDFTMIFAAALIYMIMASLFESYIHPFTIMFSISFAFTGVALGMYLLNVPMDTNASYGLLILFGIVVNNGIVLVDHINRYRKQGLVRREAIIRGGQDRLRPIMMTATTTILGLMPLVVPMIYGTAEGYARRWGPIGLVVVSGLMTSTLLTLVLLPTVYSLMDDLSGYAKRVSALARMRLGRGAPEGEEVLRPVPAAER